MRDIIQVIGVNKTLKKQRILADVSLSVRQGAVVGLIGNNGSGKSVLLKCICGLMIPDSGEVWVGGQLIGKDVDFAQNVGAVIEAPGFLPKESGYNNLQYLWNINRKVEKSNIERCMDIVGLSARDRKPVGKYSLGMRQRLGIAQALLDNPQILILDEPFNGLDKHARAEMHGLLRDLHQAGKTMMMTSHNPSDIEALCEKVYEIDPGRVETIVG